MGFSSDARPGMSEDISTFWTAARVCSLKGRTAKMKIAVAGDSAGAPLAKVLAEHLSGKDGFEVFEVSTPPAGESEYYANLSERVCHGILDGTYDRAIL